MRPITTAERERLAPVLDETEIPVCVDPELEMIDGFALGGQAVGWLPGRRRVVLREEVFESYDNEQLRGLVAHELGHHLGPHTFVSYFAKSVGMVLGVAVIGGGLLQWLRTWDLWRLAFLLIAAILLLPALQMWSAAVSRRLEYDANRRAIELLGDSAPVEALLEPRTDEPRPSTIREYYGELCYPWPHPADQLAALGEK
ncbi:M48 family metalloprotease [Halocatena marina]|uniref:M48 family metalloprotease n=1 Tax=Halocatena marina TaxID=2934937 RepID=UPI00200FDAF5|nr:M48 family metalloprotease [Halocatena marina]